MIEVGFVYQIKDLQNNKIQIGYRTSLDYKHLRQKLKNEIVQGYYLTELLEEDDFKSNFDSRFLITKLFESNDKNELVKVRDSYIISNKSYLPELGYNKLLKRYIDKKTAVDLFGETGTLESFCKRMNITIHMGKSILSLYNIKYYQSGMRNKKSLQLKDRKTKHTIHFDSRSDAVDWIIQNKLTESDNKENVYKTLRRALSGKRKTAFGFDVFVADEDATYHTEIKYNAEELEPMVAMPYNPGNGKKAKDLGDAELVVITAGAAQKEGETRIDLLQKNAAILKDITRQVVDSGFNGIFLVATNPVDILTQVVYEESGFPSSKVIGSGTTLDTARLRYEISKYLKIDSRNIHAYILGEHGDSEFVCWSNAQAGVKPIKDVIKDNFLKFEHLDEIYLNVRDAAYEIIKKKRATYYGIGMALVRVTNAILHDENSILPVSTLVNGEYDCPKGYYVGLPAIINENGVDHIMKLELSIDELAKLNKSVNVIKDSLESIK